jgi:hypothetical protein
MALVNSWFLYAAYASSYKSAFAEFTNPHNSNRINVIQALGKIFDTPDSPATGLP